MNEYTIGLLGATSLLGQSILSFLKHTYYLIYAFSRNPTLHTDSTNIFCKQLPSALLSPSTLYCYAKCDYLICAAPIWVLGEHFSFLETLGMRRIVAISSTSRYTKADSTDQFEQDTANRLQAGEEALKEWADAKGIEWVILQPTLIYGYGQDKNIAEIARIIKKTGFFPLLGEAKGLRQPIHADDVAQACVAALESPLASNRTFVITGGETLSYRAMVCRIFEALSRRPLFLVMPRMVFRCLVTFIRILPRYRHWSSAMVERMNRDLVFDHSDAARTLGFKPRPFMLAPKDLPE